MIFVRTILFSLTILAHSLAHHTARRPRCILDRLGSPMDACQCHLSTRRISGNLWGESILDGQRFGPLNLKLWCSALDIWIHRYRCSILQKTHGWLTEIEFKRTYECLPSADLHPSRLAVSGHTHVPEYSSKCKPAVHIISMASPSMQL